MKRVLRCAARRSQRARDVRAGRVAPPSEEQVHSAARRVAADSIALSAGFEVWSRHVADGELANAARAMSIEERAIAMALAGGPTRTGDRLRWEWLASTAAQLDGAPHARLAAEVLRFVDEIERSLRSLERDAASSPIAARVRGAVATARHLAALFTPPPALATA